jgi:hypothetical protein
MRRLIILTVAALGVAVVLAGCGEKYSAERDGKELGQAVCDLRDADNEQETDEAQAEVNDKLNDLIEKYAFMTADDRQQLEDTLDQLRGNVADQNFGLAQQDLATLEANVNDIRERANEVSRAAWDGFSQGVSDCTQG